MQAGSQAHVLPASAQCSPGLAGGCCDLTRAVDHPIEHAGALAEWHTCVVCGEIVEHRTCRRGCPGPGLSRPTSSAWPSPLPQLYQVPPLRALGSSSPAGVFYDCGPWVCATPQAQRGTPLRPNSEPPCPAALKPLWTLLSHGFIRILWGPEQLELCGFGAAEGLEVGTQQGAEQGRVMAEAGDSWPWALLWVPEESLSHG